FDGVMKHEPHVLSLWTRRTPAAPSNREPHGNTSFSSSSNSGSCKGSDCSPTKGRHQKYTSCTDNHGIRPPPPEQYLTPLQQKEVCIRHLRARLKETMSTLQDRDTEIDELRGQLYRMQEDWVEEECHRVEAQLALKEARQEIQQLKQAVETVRARLSDAGGLSGDAGVQKYFQDINAQNHKLENLLVSMELAQAGLAKETSVSARSLTRSSTYTKLSDQALADRNSNGTDFPCLSGDGTQDSGFVCCGESSVPSRADLLLEAAFLSEETASLLNSYSPASPGLSPGAEQPRTSQPRRSTSHEEIAGVMVVEVSDEEDEDDTGARGNAGNTEAEDEESPASGTVQKSYWSRHFLVDLLAVAIPVVPTVAWLCRGPVRDGQPMYHIGSLLRGCCTVALHSLRRGGGLRHYPAGGGDLGGSQI
uniref:Syntaphilin b n=1 Tax=Salarias fasciatus TaxID=181472 RepID=A0A672IER9_SALFA